MLWVHCKEFCYSWVSCCSRNPEAEPLLTPTNESHFPPPSTVLTPPRPRAKLPGTGHSSTSSLSHLRAGPQSAGPSAKQSVERLQETAKISNVYSRMKTVISSQPPTPSTDHFSSVRYPASSATTPVVSRHRIQPLSSPEDEIAARTHPLPTPLPRTGPTSPRGLARSVSDPQLIEIEGFGRHQVVRSRNGSISVVRGRARATTINNMDRPSLRFQAPIGFAEARRGRSPGPRASPLGQNNPSSSALDLGSSNRPPGSDSGSEPIEIGRDQEVDIVRRDLGIRDMFRGGRGRQRGRPGRGRAITH